MRKFAIAGTASHYRSSSAIFDEVQGRRLLDRRGDDDLADIGVVSCSLAGVLWTPVPSRTRPTPSSASGSSSICRARASRMRRPVHGEARGIMGEVGAPPAMHGAKLDQGRVLRGIASRTLRRTTSPGVPS
jgi:hypothetical protein